MASASYSATTAVVVVAALASATISGSIHGAAAASTLMQNVCGTDYNHALECGTPCPGVSFGDYIISSFCANTQKSSSFIIYHYHISHRNIIICYAGKE